MGDLLERLARLNGDSLLLKSGREQSVGRQGSQRPAGSDFGTESVIGHRCFLPTPRLPLAKGSVSDNQSGARRDQLVIVKFSEARNPSKAFRR
jgi:hypothetical protein